MHLAHVMSVYAGQSALPGVATTVWPVCRTPIGLVGIGRSHGYIDTMTGRRIILWVGRHQVGLSLVMVVLWLANAMIQIIAIANGDTGTNGGHVFSLVLALLIAVLSAANAVIALTAKTKKTAKDQTHRADPQGECLAGHHFGSRRRQQRRGSLTLTVSAVSIRAQPPWRATRRSRARWR